MSTPRSQQQPSLAGFPREDFQGFYDRDRVEATGYLRRWCYGAKRSRLQRQQLQFADQGPCGAPGRRAATLPARCPYLPVPGQQCSDFHEVCPEKLPAGFEGQTQTRS